MHRARSARRHLHEDLVGFDHAQLHARLFFDHAQAGLQVFDFGAELIVGQARLVVGRLLLVNLALQPRHVGHAAAPKPQLRVDDDQQHDQDGWDGAVGHVGTAFPGTGLL